ncbi:MAG: ATP-dependent DNA helicase RecG [Candidatus Pacebacteria bacterium]|nr:ATP-dependent DNA helicase RecG [Candidatus Paceibacterota bacterium]
MTIYLKTPIEELPFIGSAYVKKLHRVGIETAEDLLFYFPFRYDDFSDVKNIGEVELGEVVSVVGKIVDIQNIRTRKRKMNLTEAMIEDESGVIKAIWFNQPFLTRNLRSGINVSLSGKVVYAQDGFQISNPSYELLGSGQSLHTARLVPIYHETEGLSSKWLRVHLKSVLKLAEDIEEFLPASIIKNQNLLSLSEAISQIHFPDNEESSKIAKRRLAFDELFLVQLYMMMQKKKWQENKGVKIKFDKSLEKEVKDFVESLPFKLTNAQRISSWNIIKDFEKNKPMNRLLEGDVGSGKTLVALISALAVIKSGYQVAFMAPTEILARQHFEEAVRRLGGIYISNPSQEGNFIEGSIVAISSVEPRTQDNPKGAMESLKMLRVALFTGSESKIFQGEKIEEISKKKLLEKIRIGGIDLLIGTHSLIQKKVEFHNLAFSIIDEQHRFGIEQRGKLQNEVVNISDGLKTVPHLLSMTATPIPRTLALTVYGDLDLSILDEMPKGRQKIITKLVAPANRNLVYQFIGEQVQKGRQVFVICPLIEESDVLEVRSATEEYEKLKNIIYKDFQIGFLHGKMKPKEKEEVMQKFSQGKIDILVSTSVVEVGIDIPNASVMLIEGSDRFGLAQLHQFRGRVGRGEYQSFCFLFTDSTSVTTARRLKALVKSDNGFELAEQDLKIRGPGELVGVRQSGLPDLAMASLSDAELIKKTRDEAKALLEKDGKLLKYPKLEEKLKKFTKEVHFE